MKDRGQALAVEAQKDRLKRTRDEIAKKAGYKSRSAYYKHIKDPMLPYHILTKYGKVLGVDFTTQFPDMPKYMIAQDPEAVLYGKPTNLEEAVQMLEGCREEYFRLQSKYNRLADKMNDMLSPGGS